MGRVSTTAFSMMMVAALLVLLLVSSAAARDVQVGAAAAEIEEAQPSGADNVYDIKAVVSYDEVKQTLNFKFTLALGSMTFQGTSFVGRREGWGTPATFDAKLIAKVQLSMGRPRLFTFQTDTLPFGLYGGYVLNLTSDDGNLRFTATFPALPTSPAFGSGEGSGLWVPSYQN